MASNSLMVYGARCVWWDSIDAAATLPSGLPCCPHCSSVLFQMDEPEWWKGVRQHSEKEPGYQAFVQWLRGRCFPTLEAARKAFVAPSPARLVARGMAMCNDCGLYSQTLTCTRCDGDFCAECFEDEHQCPDPLDAPKEDG